MKASTLLKNTLYISLCSGAALYVYAEDPQKSLNGAVSANWAVLGAPTFYQTEKPTSNTICMNTANKTIGINPTTGFNFDSTVTHDQPDAALNLGGSTELPILESVGISANANAQFSASVANNKYTYNYIYLYTYNTETRLNTVYGNDNLNANGINALNAGQDAFLNTCGNSFVSNLNAGVVLAVNVAVTLQSQAQAVAFGESVSIALSKQPLNRIVQSASFSESGVGENAIVTITAMQNGGTPESLATVLGGALSKPCQINNVSNCEAMTNQLGNYVSTIASQISDGGNLIESRLYYSNPIIQTYASIGVGVPAPQPLPQNVLNSQAAVIDEINLSQNRINFLQNYLHSGLNLSPDVTNFINSQTKRLQARIDYIANSSIDCFNANAMTCPTIVKNITTRITTSQIYSFDKEQYTYLNTAIQYLYNGRSTIIVPTSFYGTYNTLAGGYPDGLGLSATVYRTPKPDVYTTEIDIPNKNFFNSQYMNKCFPVSDADKYAQSRTFTCTDGLFNKFNLQFQTINTPL